MTIEKVLALTAGLFCTMVSTTGERRMQSFKAAKLIKAPKSDKISKGKKSPKAITIANFEGITFEGSDERHCYRVTTGSGLYYQDDLNAACTPPFRNDFSVGKFDRIEDGKAIYNDGAYCLGVGRVRTGTLEVEEDTSISEIEVTFSEPFTCVYKAVIKVPSLTKVQKATSTPKNSKGKKVSKGPKMSKDRKSKGSK